MIHIPGIFEQLKLLRQNPWHVVQMKFYMTLYGMVKSNLSQLCSALLTIYAYSS